jgi:hypothetical protein
VNNLEIRGVMPYPINVLDHAMESGLPVQILPHWHQSNHLVPVAVHGEDGLLVRLGHRTLKTHVKRQFPVVRRVSELGFLHDVDSRFLMFDSGVTRICLRAYH